MNKAPHELNPLDLKLRRLFSIGEFAGTKVTIELVNGFELFNTRRYHNYETWSDGYYAYFDKGGVRYFVNAEDLDECVEAISQKLSSIANVESETNTTTEV